MRNRTKWMFATGGVLAFGAAAFFTGRALAGGGGIPASKPLVYAGLLQNSDGSPLVGTGHNIEIKLWNDASASAGANLLCDTNSQPLATDATGRFSLSLGDDCTKGIAANAETYVEVLLDGAVLGGKRSRLGAVPYAVAASHAVSADKATTAESATTAAGASSALGALNTRIAKLEAVGAAPMITAWTSFEPQVTTTATGFPGVTGISRSTGSYRRVGDSIEVNITTRFNATSSDTGVLDWKLPSSLQGAFTNTWDGMVTGIAEAWNGGQATICGVEQYANDPTGVIVYCPSGGLTRDKFGPGLNYWIALHYTVPISGWTVSGP